MMATSTRKPVSCPKEPRSKGEDTNDTERNRRVVETLTGDRVLCRKAEDNGNEHDPPDSDNRHGLGRSSKMKRAALEVAWVYEGHANGNAVGDVETNGSYGCGAAESDIGTEGWEGEEERASSAEEDGPNR